jgi:hypothetical protein
VDENYGMGKPSPDKMIESWLENTWQIPRSEYTLEYVPIGQVDKELSLRMQNRGREVLTLDQHHLSKMLDSVVKFGIVLPPLVGIRLPDGRIVLSDGNHRYDVTEVTDATHVAIYIITTINEVEDPLFRRMCLHANQLNGKPLTRADALNNALDDIELGGSITKTAELYGIPENGLRRERAIRKGRGKAIVAGLKEGRNLDPALAVEIGHDAFHPDLIAALGNRISAASGTELKRAREALKDMSPAEMAEAPARLGGMLDAWRVERNSPKNRNGNKKGDNKRSPFFADAKKCLEAARKLQATLEEHPEYMGDDNLNLALLVLGQKAKAHGSAQESAA